MYKVDDVVVYRRDVCKVVGLTVSDMTGEECYILEPYHETSGGAVMKVPVSNKAGNLRDVISKKQITDLVKAFPNVEALADKPANMKSQYVTLLKGNKLEDLLCVIKTAYARNKTRLDNHKKLATIDSEFLNKAEKYLFNEISVATGLSYNESKEYFINLINESN